jgi:hypothetical protein
MSHSTANNTSTPLLLDARSEYLDQLTDAIVPCVAKYLNAVYTDVQQAGRRAHLVFRQRLSDVAGWNSTIIRERTQDILTACPYFSNLVCAIIVAHVKVLSSIKVRKDSTSVRVKVPNDDAVVHVIYTETAKNLLLSPQLVQSRKELRVLLRQSTETAIKSFIPLKSLLDAYLGDSVDQVTGTIVARDDEYGDDDEEYDDDEYDDDDENQNRDSPIDSLRSPHVDGSQRMMMPPDGVFQDQHITGSLVDAHFSDPKKNVPMTTTTTTTLPSAGMAPLRDVSPGDIKHVPLTTSSIPPLQKQQQPSTSPKPPHPAFIFDDEQDDFQ